MSFYCPFFLNFFSKNMPVSNRFDFFFNRHKSGVFLMKNVQNQKYCIISTSFFLQYYGPFRRLNAPNSLRTETCKKTWNIWGNPLLATERLYFYLIYIFKNTALWCPFEFLYEKKPAWEQFVFNEKCPKSKIQYTMDVFFCTPKTYRSHAHLIFFVDKNRHESRVLLTENFKN